jgi:nucleotide-binding universal stress UspA family protein
MKTIICPVDFSPCSENAALYAAQLAKEFKSRLILLHVYESPFLYTESSVSSAGEIEKNIQETADKNIYKLKEVLLHINKDISIDTITKEGNADKETCLLASKENADVITMGTTGKNRAKQVLLGSTSLKVISEAQHPVLLIPESGKYRGINKIVFATDLHEDNLNAALQIVSFAMHFKSEIVFVYVDNKDLIHSEENIASLTRKIREHVRYNKMSGYITKITDVTDGIEYFLKINPADLLVMFTHQKHFPQTLLKPSLTKKVSQAIHIPLLALPVHAHTLTGISK